MRDAALNLSNLQIPGAGSSLWERLRYWRRIARERRRLRELDERELADIGLRREDALGEAARNFWDVRRPTY